MIKRMKKESASKARLSSDIKAKKSEMANFETPNSIAKLRELVGMLEDRVSLIEKYLGVKNGK